MATTTEVWEEQRGKRSALGKLIKWSFVLFNLWMVAEVVMMVGRVEQVRSQYRGNGFAQLGIAAVSNARLNELFVIWAVGAAVLGLGVLATRGKKQMVRRVEALPK